MNSSYRHNSARTSSPKAVGRNAGARGGHHFSPETCTDFMRKVRGSLNPVGRAVILEMAPNEDRISPPIAAGFSLTMLATTAEGDAYTHTQLVKFCRDAGFAKAEAHPLLPTPQTAVVTEA
jgi:hypothetical protein